MSSTPNYDSEFCGKVPIHLINTVQPYGALLVIERSSLQLIQVSENTESIFGLPAPALLADTLEDKLDSDSFNFLRQIAGSPGRTGSEALEIPPEKIPLVWTIREIKYLALLHVKTNYLLAEIETEPFRESEQQSFVSVYQQIKFSMALIESASDTREVCAIAARELKKISGFDKVMIYRFDPQWNGTVIAEEREEDMESYSGFTFPASDIPRQARELYLRNPYRFIPDRKYEPVRLFPVMNPATRSFIDLSECNVRGVVAVHLEYLANMGVVASMSARILNNEQLWGLIACHHKTPKTISFQLGSVFELLSNTISAKLLSLQNKEQREDFALIRTAYDRLIEQLYDTGDLRKGLFGKQLPVTGLFNAGGAALNDGSDWYTSGIVPENGQLEELLLWLQTRRPTRLLHTDHLPEDFEQARTYQDKASGLLALSLDPEKEQYLLLFRPETEKWIDWGGDPSGRIVFEKDERAYHPRNSFKQWRQLVKGVARPWKNEELAVAETLRSFLYEYNNK